MHVFLAGISWKEKVADLRLKMAERSIVWFVVTALDEIACEYSGFPARPLPHILLGPLGICVLPPFSFLNAEGIITVSLSQRAMHRRGGTAVGQRSYDPFATTVHSQGAWRAHAWGLPLASWAEGL